MELLDNELFHIVCPLQSFAESLDRYDHEDILSKDNRAFVWKYLGGPLEEDANLQSTVMDLAFWHHAGHQEFDYAAQVLCRYRLLDIFADLLGVPKHPDIKPVPSMPFDVNIDIPHSVYKVSAII